MKRDKKQLRYTKTTVRYFKKNNIKQVDFENDIEPMVSRFHKPHWPIEVYPKIVVTFNDGTQKEAKSYQAYPLKIEYKEKINDN